MSEMRRHPQARRSHASRSRSGPSGRSVSLRVMRRAVSRGGRILGVRQEGAHMASEQQPRAPVTLTKPALIQNPHGGWNVEQFDDDGGCYVTNFTGPDAEARARAYAA